MNKYVKARWERLLGAVLASRFLMPVLWYFYIRADRIWYYISRKIYTVIWLTPQQKNRILCIVLWTPILIALLWNFGVAGENLQIEGLQRKTAYANDILTRLWTVKAKEKTIAAELETQRHALERQEQLLVPEWDALAWVLSTVTSFSKSHNGITIIACSQPDLIAEGV